MSSDLKMRSNELICWLTADWVTSLICAALVKLSDSAKSQKTFKLSICISGLVGQASCCQHGPKRPTLCAGHNGPGRRDACPTSARTDYLYGFNQLLSEAVNTCFTRRSSSWLVKGFGRNVAGFSLPLART